MTNQTKTQRIERIANLARDGLLTIEEAAARLWADKVTGKWSRGRLLWQDRMTGFRGVA